MNEIDKKDKENIYTCADYAEDVSRYLRGREKITELKNTLLSNQKEIKEIHRERVIEWMVGVQMRYKLTDETLYMAINILDRYLDKETIKKSNFSLLGLTAILIASKYEEIYPPHLKNFVGCCDEDFSSPEIFRLDRKSVV